MKLERLNSADRVFRRLRSSPSAALRVQTGCAKPRLPCGTAEGRTLNREYRHKDYATNVLTFDYTQEPVVSADLVLCAPVVAMEAKEQGKTLEEHYAHLLVHGTLHAQGYEHETNEVDALEMEALEVLLMEGMGYGNPYE
jgi:probable rRNA maturation factor